MKFGLFLVAQNPAEDSMVQRLHEMVEQVRAARDAGFDLIATGQHYLSAPYQMLQTLPFLARMAAEAGSMQVAATVVLLPLQNPVDMAEQVATLDVICQGRFIFGVGLGYRDEEYIAFGVERRERVGRFVEALDLIKRLWTEEELEHRGRYYHVPRVNLVTRPVQRPYPPIWIAANNDAAVQRAARLGHPWLMNPHTTLGTLERQTALYHQALREVGNDPPPDLPLSRDLYIGESPEAALWEATPYLKKKYEVYAAWGQDKALPDRESFAVPFEELLKDRFIIGGPEECVQEIHRYQERLGVTHVLLRIQWPGMPNDLVLREIDLLGSKVIPHFK